MAFGPDNEMLWIQALLTVTKYLKQVIRYWKIQIKQQKHIKVNEILKWVLFHTLALAYSSSSIRIIVCLFFYKILLKRMYWYTWGYEKMLCRVQWLKQQTVTSWRETGDCSYWILVSSPDLHMPKLGFAARVARRPRASSTSHPGDETQQSAILSMLGPYCQLGGTWGKEGTVYMGPPCEEGS